MVSQVSEDSALHSAADGRGFAVSRAYERYIVGLLLAVGVCSFIDRQIFSILLESIKQDLSLSDTEMGLLGGLAFSIFYVTVGIPIAWIADSANRRNIIGLAVGTWSVMTTLCGFATGFALLLAETFFAAFLSSAASLSAASLASRNERRREVLSRIA